MCSVSISQQQECAAAIHHNSRCNDSPGPTLPRATESIWHKSHRYQAIGNMSPTEELQTESRPPELAPADARPMNIEFARRQMVAQQVRAWEVFDSRVLGIMETTPREQFVPAAFAELAFADTEIPLGHGQYMMTPTLEGRLLQALKLLPGDRVLEIGTGSGYLSACLAGLAQSVVSVDIFTDLTEAAGRKHAELGIDNVRLLTIDAARELPEGTFDVIAVTASLPLFDTRFLAPLKPGGRLFVIVGSAPIMDAQLVVRRADDRPETTSLFETNVLPMLHAASPPAFQF